MAAIQITDVTDLVNATLSKYGRNMMTDAVTTLQDYVACNRLLDKGKIVYDSGQSYKFNVLHTADSNARTVGLFTVDNLDQVDGTVQGTVPWRFIESGCHYDVKQLSANDGKERIFNFVKEKEYQMWVGFYELLEQYFWDGPTSSTDVKSPFGLLNYWLDYGNYSSGGFEGGNHTNFSGGPAGISATTYTRWKHWVNNYSSVSDTDLIRKMRKAVRNCRFKGIKNKPIKENADGAPRYGIYTTEDTLSLMEELIDTKNENIGLDLAKYDDAVVFHRIPIEWVPYLQENHATSDPVIGLDWNQVKVAALSGEWMRQTPYHQNGMSHDVRQRFVNCSFNICMTNRRNNFLIAKSDPMSD